MSAFSTKPKVQPMQYLNQFADIMNLILVLVVCMHVCILMYASNAWWGFCNANDRQIFAFIRRCIRTGFCSPDLADFHDLYVSSDEKLFDKIITCQNHILRTLLSPHTAQNYSLRN